MFEMRKATLLFAEKATSLFAEKPTSLFAKKPTLLFPAYTKQLIPNLSPITYTETLIYTKDIEEQSIDSHLMPAENITKEQIADFFVDQLRKIKDEIE